jgi:hypothetical protein
MAGTSSPFGECKLPAGSISDFIVSAGVFAVLPARILFSRALFCGLHFAGVAQICNLLHRRIAFGRTLELSAPLPLAAASGLQIRDPGDCNSALLRSRLWHAVPFALNSHGIDPA